ncbi:hypothetical protein PHLCEN_2v1688 [Hermanssonia centrifuga]|uniref:Uncharacterized protein n=1 Tax=Hermanssonia centrifuga TaxID=98765 RepID=A0A2R6RZ90_9APHY|nr:hypothetical protein PHLCEN_2v1688 [Hermanssonia centrifuga]
MAGKLARRPAQKSDSRAHKKARLAPASKTKPLRKGTPPPPKAKVNSSRKPKRNAPVTTTRSDTKGKAKAVSTEDEDDNAVVELPSSFKVMAGSYEKLLYGLEGTVSVEGSSHKFSLRPMFIFPAHISCIKSIAASPQGGKWLATGSADEIVKVWDLRRRKEIGGLMHHEGSITHLEFPSRSHLLSASEDGTLCLFRARDWSVLRSLKGHKGRVNSVAVHPSGKVALSVGQDRTLRMWDLMRGKGSGSTKIYKEGELVRWSTDGDLFVLQTLFTLDIYSTDVKLLHTITHPSRIHDVKFCKRAIGEGEVLLVAAEDKKVSVYDLPSDRTQVPTVVAEMIGHTNRVKAVDMLHIALPSISDSPRTSTTVVSTISSDGKVRLFDLASVPENATPEKLQLEALTEYDTKGSRLTCLALADGDVQVSPVQGKRKRVVTDNAEEDEEGSEEDKEVPDEMEGEGEDESEEEEEIEEESEDEAEDE